MVATSDSCSQTQIENATNSHPVHNFGFDIIGSSNRSLQDKPVNQYPFSEI